MMSSSTSGLPSAGGGPPWKSAVESLVHRKYVFRHCCKTRSLTKQAKTLITNFVCVFPSVLASKIWYMYTVFNNLQIDHKKRVWFEVYAIDSILNTWGFKFGFLASE